jgi:hypothetical protein
MEKAQSILCKFEIPSHSKYINIVEAFSLFNYLVIESYLTT